MLSDVDSDDSSGPKGHQLVINEHYAKTFEYRKEREELQKLKDKYGSDADSSQDDSESDESEDEDGEQLTPAVDAALLRTLAKIKRKDPDIYLGDKKIFQEEHSRIQPVAWSASSSSAKPSKSLSVRQAALQSVLSGSRSPSPSPQVLSHVDEQTLLRSETIAAFQHAEVDHDEDTEDLLVPREKNPDELEQEEQDYRSFLEQQVGPDLEQLVAPETEVPSSTPKPAQEQKKKSKPSKEKLVSKEQEDHEFLMQYIFNRGWIDRSARRIPTYGEVTSKGKEKAVDQTKNQSQHVDGEMDSDEFEDIADQFETSYNFRFEEPEADKIRTFPRQINSAVRREDTTRKDARERKTLRTEDKKQQKREEIKRLKALKMKELKSKLDQISKEGGLEDLGLGDSALLDLGLDADWDPDKHDSQMVELYQEFDDDGEGDLERPTWGDDIDIGDIVPQSPTTSQPGAESSSKKKKRKRDEKNTEEGVDIDAMDADQEQPDNEWDGTEEMRKKVVEKYMDEIYALDFNDMVGGMPTRFHYAKVDAETFALTPAEILLATDQELNEYMSIKKYAPYRKDKQWDSKRGEKLQNLRSKLGERTPKDWIPESANDDKSDKKRRPGKKERQRLKAEPPSTLADDHDTVEPTPKKQKLELPNNLEQSEGKKKRKRHKKTVVS